MLLEKLISISAMLSIAPHLPGSFFVVGYYQEVWGKGPSWRGLCLAMARESTAGCDGMCGGGLGIQGNF